MEENIVKEYITIPKGGRPKKEVSERFKDLAHKYTIKELASQFGISTTTVYRWLKESGIKKYGKNKNSSRPMQEIPEGLGELAKEFTIKELAERFNTSTATISRWMREKGIKKREEKATITISIEEYNQFKILKQLDIPKEERELALIDLQNMQEKYIEGEGYERHPLPEYYALETAIKVLNLLSDKEKLSVLNK